MIKDRLISLFNRQRTTTWFEKQTGIDRYRWQNVRNGKARLSDAEIEAIVLLFPQYAYWLVTGNVAPEIGQVSPDYEASQTQVVKA
ncbi:DNA-binding protein [Pseudomonas sp. BN515]|uniref:DNA-binding protein n=1 Tax=Pseudomonas sp. BN515 TaxID=2567892 RepID=UPI0024568DF7|nr:DNA-binding protein [Pseudomonas sp. BN515]MDH4870589.1 DNA-binding protein [Pseudomonas sp. BN515]